MLLTLACTAALAQDAPPQSDVTRTLLQAKTVYVLSGHVRSYKNKGLSKKELVDETPL